MLWCTAWAWGATAGLGAPITDDRGALGPPLDGAEIAPVVGGTAVPGPYDGPVVGIAGPGGVFCTGVVVDPQWVLTAAHCLAADPPPTAVWWGADLRQAPTQPGAVVAVDLERSRVDPAWLGGAAHAHDVALVALASPAPSGPARLAAGVPAVGERLDVTGYGDTADGAGDGGVLRTARLDVLDVDEGLVRTYTPGKNLCSGDSGAPLSVPGAAPLLVHAVGGFVDPTCLGGAGGGVPVDAVWPFLSDTVPALDRSPVPVRGDTADTGTADPDTGDPGTGHGPVPPTEGCGCSGGAGGGVGVWLAAAWIRVRRRRRPRPPGRRLAAE